MNIHAIALGMIGFLTTSVVTAGSLTGIVGNWHFDEETGQTLNDLSGYRKHAVRGATNLVEVDDPTWITRRFDTAALAFDGEDDLVRVPHSTVLEPKKISVEAWVKSDGNPLNAPRYLVAKSNMACVMAAYALYTGGTGGLSFYVSSGTTYVESPDAGPGVWDGAWHHVVGTYDRLAVRLYVDGKEIGGGTAAKFAIGYSAFAGKDVYIGDYDGGQACYLPANFKGGIDEVRIWNRALTPAEVAVRAQGD